MKTPKPECCVYCGNIFCKEEPKSPDPGPPHCRWEFCEAAADAEAVEGAPA